MSRLHLITYGGGSLRWRMAARRLATQARASGWFDSVHPVTDVDLPKLVPEVVDRHGRFMSSNPRGNGYWVWRPPLLRHFIATTRRDDVVLFLDAGCELNVNDRSRSRLMDYAQHARSRDLLAMRTEFPLPMWTKGDLLDATNTGGRRGDECLIEPGAMLLRCSVSNIDRMGIWEEWCEADNYHFLDDSPSTRPNDTSFVEHRHDQSILTCLEEQLELHAIPQETYFPGAWLSRGSTYPIWATRNRWPIRRESGNVAERALSRIHVRLTGKETLS